MNKNVNVFMVKCTDCNGKEFPGFLFVHEGEVYSKGLRDDILRQAIPRIVMRYYQCKQQQQPKYQYYYYGPTSGGYSTNSSSYYSNNTTGGTWFRL